jgi:hypothetical protein
MQQMATGMSNAEESLGDGQKANGEQVAKPSTPPPDGGEWEWNPTTEAWESTGAPAQSTPTTHLRWNPLTNTYEEVTV